MAGKELSENLFKVQAESGSGQREARQFLKSVLKLNVKVKAKTKKLENSKIKILKLSTQ